MSRLVVAALQMQSGTDKERNLSAAEALVDEAVERGAGLIALPEHFNFGGAPQLQRENAEPIPGPSVDRMREKARTARVYLVGGSLAERVEEDARVFNTSLMIDPQGDITAKYSKVHLFDAEIGSQLVMKEGDVFAPGDSIVAAETGYGVVGLTICYDLRFPELYRALALKGARIIFVVSSFMASTGKAHWEPLLRARAIENQVFIVAPNQIGPIPGTKLLRYGHSAIVDPWGRVLSEASDNDGVITAEIDFDYLTTVRRQLPSLAGRRPEVYREGSWC
jgi:predicted amidohydrolase